MASASRWLAALILVLAAPAGQAALLRFALPCERPVLLAGGESLQPAGRVGPAEHPFASRVQALVRRACGGDDPVVTIVEPDGRVGLAYDAVEAALRSKRPGVAFFDFPAGDIANGASVDEVLARYAALLRTCDAVASLCIIGGQRPLDGLGAEHETRQLELERRATARFGARYLATYAHFQSEARNQRAIPALVAGSDQRYLSDTGHELLFNLHRRRLAELTATQH